MTEFLVKREVLLKNLRDRDWVRQLVSFFLSDKLASIKEYDESWDDDHPSDSGHREKDFEEKGLVLWSSYRRGNPLFGRYVHGSDHSELVLFESGEFAILAYHDSSGAVRSSFESFAYWSGYSVRRGFLTPDEFQNYAEGIVAALLSLLQDCVRCQIESLAHSYWMERGCPHGSAEEDWFRAEHEVERRLRETFGDSWRSIHDD